MVTVETSREERTGDGKEKIAGAESHCCCAGPAGSSDCVSQAGAAGGREMSSQ